MDGSMARIARLQDEVLQAVFLITARGITLGMKTSRTWREFVRTFCVCPDEIDVGAVAGHSG